MGEDMVSPVNARQQSLQPSAQVFSYGASTSTSSTLPKPAALFGGSRRKNVATVKIIHAEMTFKNEKSCPTFHEMDQTYLNISEENSNVNFLVNKARESFNDATLELVTTNGLKICDNEGTRGEYYN